MKYFIIIFLCLSSLVMAQETIVVKKSDLPAEVLASLEQQKQIQDVTSKLRVAQEWSGIGREVGEAINDGLKGVTEQAAVFAETTPGKATMILIAWKIMAKDIITLGGGLGRTIFGIGFLIFLNLLLITSWFRTTRPGRVLVLEDKDGKHYGPGETWFTKAGSNDGDVTAFVVCWFCVAAIGNVWVIAGVIL